MQDVNPIDQVLEERVKDGSEICITLRDGSYVQGKVKDYDGYVILFDGVPQTVVYRHAILKLGRARTVKTERPSLRPAPQAQTQHPPRQPHKRPQNRPPERPAYKDASEGPGQIGAMGEAMLKWLQSQKGGG